MFRFGTHIIASMTQYSGTSSNFFLDVLSIYEQTVQWGFPRDYHCILRPGSLRKARLASESNHSLDFDGIGEDVAYP